MNKVKVAITLTLLIAICPCFVRLGYAGVPAVANVIVFNDGEDTILNVTVSHSAEELFHFVNLINVTIGDGNPLSFPQSGPHASDPVSGTFDVTLNIGSIVDTPIAIVRAHCIIHGWSDLNNASWTGPIPEFSSALILLALAVGAAVVLVTSKKISIVGSNKTAPFANFSS